MSTDPIQDSLIRISSHHTVLQDENEAPKSTTTHTTQNKSWTETALSVGASMGSMLGMLTTTTVPAPVNPLASIPSIKVNIDTHTHTHTTHVTNNTTIEKVEKVEIHNYPNQHSKPEDS